MIDEQINAYATRIVGFASILFLTMQNVLQKVDKNSTIIKILYHSFNKKKFNNLVRVCYLFVSRCVLRDSYLFHYEIK